MSIPLAARCAATLRDSVRRRGESYFRQGRVRIQDLDGQGLAALVQGSEPRPYEVLLDWSEARDRQIVSADCSCAFFDGGEICKHIWATVLKVDERRPTGVVSGDQQLHLAPSHLLDMETEEDLRQAPGRDRMNAAQSEREGRWNPARSSSSAIENDLVSRPPSPKLVVPRPPARDWRRGFEEIQSFQQGRVDPASSSASAVSGPTSWVSPALQRPKQAWYLLDLHATLRRDALKISFFQRETRKSGSLGKLKPLRLRGVDVQQFADPADREILGWILGAHLEDDSYGFSRGYEEWTHRGCVIHPPLYDVLLPRLCATQRFLAMRDGDPRAAIELPLRWDEGPAWRFRLQLEQAGEPIGWKISGVLEREGESRDVSEPSLLIEGGLVLFSDTLARFDAREAFSWILYLRRHGPMRVPLEQEETMLEHLFEMRSLPPLAAPEDLNWRILDGVPRPRIRISAPASRAEWRPLRVTLFADYDGQVVDAASPKAGIVDREQRKLIVRNLGHEREFLQRLMELGVGWERGYPEGTRDLILPAQKMGSVVQALTTEGWVVEAEGRRIRQPGEFHFKLSSGTDWFDLEGGLEFEGIEVPLPALLDALRRGDAFVRLDDGSEGILPEEWLARYGQLIELGQAKGDRLRYVPAQAALLDALLAAQDRVEVDETFARVRAQLRSFDGITPRDPEIGFRGKLRDYQRLGLGWLLFLQEFHLGGCLADDMGLGKTIQVLALLLNRRRSSPSADEPARPPSLVVVPRSLVYNWIEEAARFTPELRVLDYTGLGRSERFAEFPNYDLIVTTYGTLRRDIPTLREVRFDYAILDEAQAIKNGGSQSAKASRLIRADHRLALTGTPVENHLGEIWSIFEFLNPGMLGSSARMSSLGAGSMSAGSRAGLDEATRVLAQALRPFILRRTKARVLQELPAKTEQTLYCEMGSKQRKLYNELREHYRASLLGRVEKEGLNRSKLHVLEALLRLRQAACHPALLDRKQRSLPSAKMDILIEQLGEVVSEGHKALVFSQFTSLLALLRERLDADGVLYEYLDGKTRQRQEVVRRFQEDPDCPLFLISLKAGGQGLNLTAADYVFILDPWWNPAVEAQAIDRAHRIGQSRPVFAYRLICRDTVEEKILELQGVKRELAEAIVSEDNSLIRDLTADDLRLLLS